MTFESAIDDLCAKIAPVMGLSFVSDTESYEATRTLQDLMERRSKGLTGTSSMILDQAETVLRLVRFAGFEEDDDYFLADLACDEARCARDVRAARIPNA